ncbi:unnamed protein product [Taenia asiatica]|uniref:Fe2OG dioxygenase domain-containing protein n=1 Tax=Taenia asiatica TaxID=60517 RepID=A0A0R3WFQ1_TAEAS|nr:unnamed protein product [Taenia asiatica]
MLHLPSEWLRQRVGEFGVGYHTDGMSRATYFFLVESDLILSRIIVEEHNFIVLPLNDFKGPLEDVWCGSLEANRLDLCYRVGLTILSESLADKDNSMPEVANLAKWRKNQR